MSRTAGIISVALFSLLGLLMIRTAESQSSLKPATAHEQGEKATDNPYVPTLTFEVASVREAHFSPSEGVTMGGTFPLERSSIRLVNWSIENLLWLAYDVRPPRISGLPPWPWGTRFTIQAKGDEAADAKLASLTPEQQRIEQEHMMQVLLADRFKLKVHWDQGDGYSYALVVSKPGRMQESTGAPPSEAEIKRFGSHPVPALYQRNDGTGYDWIAHGATMNDLVPMLSALMSRPVADKTGLHGKYDFLIKYRGATDRDRAPDDLDPTPPLDQAIQDQLGLKLERKKDSVPRLVIDHIEKPSDN
jgi:uncharacterized protein (TIGR03435 family)